MTEKKFKGTVNGYVTGSKGKPDTLRLSTVLKMLRGQGQDASAEQVAQLAERVGKQCDTHGRIDDPMVFTVGKDQLAFGCSDCSAPELKKAWEEEGGPQA